ncbi:MAG: hypothetical protein KUG73_07905 [Pseudomonadales bacterium]|nr:hypothetical protein [Pseudomonadales bacterium]
MLRKLALYVAMFGLLSSAVYAESGKLYRYSDAQGRVVLNDRIPPELISKGYSILNRRGQLIKVVPRELTEEEITLRDGSKGERKQRVLQEALQKKADQRLLTIFSHPEDAERARERKIEALDVMISINQSNIVRLRSEYDVTQEQAAAQERAGKSVGEHLLEKIERFDRQIVKLEETNAEKEEEKLAVRESYAKDIERLKILIKRGRK